MEPGTEETLVLDKDKALVVDRVLLELAYILPRVAWPGPLVVSVLAVLVLVWVDRDYTEWERMAWVVHTELEQAPLRNSNSVHSLKRMRWSR